MGSGIYKTTIYGVDDNRRQNNVLSIPQVLFTQVPTVSIYDANNKKSPK